VRLFAGPLRRYPVRLFAGPLRPYPVWLVALCLAGALCRLEVQAMVRDLAPLPIGWSPLPAMTVTTHLAFPIAAGDQGRGSVAPAFQLAAESAAADPVAVAPLAPQRRIPRDGHLASAQVEPAQQALVRHIVATWGVEAAPVRQYVSRVWRTASALEIDPFLMLAVMATESSFDPRARSPRGAQGLMQVHTRMHREKFAPHGGAARAFDPEVNIRVGGQILKQYLDRHGSPRAALKAYVGAARLKGDGGYGVKVLRRHAQFRSVVTIELARLPAVVAPVVADGGRSAAGTGDRSMAGTGSWTGVGSGSRRVADAGGRQPANARAVR
jgi:hypothetical protein